MDTKLEFGVTLKRDDEGYYHINGRAYPSVSTVLNYRGLESGLVDWMVSVGKKEAERKKDIGIHRGNTVHKAIETGGDIASEFSGYLQAFHDWRATTGAILRAPETTVWSERYGYAGTIDDIVTINGGDWPIDYKTGHEKYRDQLQGALYRAALTEHGVDTRGIIIIYLRDDGSFIEKRIQDTSQLFANGLSIKGVYDAEH